ncbi:MAG: signal peptidase I [Dehalococcoidia bacterium]|nr:signal peptidase I [Dehalococcoidia bacterium]
MRALTRTPAAPESSLSQRARAWRNETGEATEERLPAGVGQPTILAKAAGTLPVIGKRFRIRGPVRLELKLESIMTKPSRILQALIRLFSSARYVVNGDSMLPSLSSGESVLAVRLRLPGGRVRRGDVVVLRNPAGTGRFYIKRIIGLPGEDIRLEGGLVYVNEVPVEETYLNRGTAAPKGDRREWWTGPEEYVVLGDNRNDSQDSRAFGPVNRHVILGRVWFRCWPLWVWGWFPGEEPG